MNEPKKHHYIPQFILKNFSFDDKGNIRYFNKRTNKITIQETRNVFMSQHLYRDEINSPDNPTKLEQDFGAFENEISKIIKSKFLKGDKITLNMEEDAKLRLFFAIMGFRTNKCRELFENGLSKDSKKFYAHYQHNHNFVDLWKRNLGYIVNCRSIQEVIDHPKIDEPIKIFFIRDTMGIIGMYFVVAERKDCDEFIIGDTYPVVITGYLPNNFPMHMYSIFPISPDRVIFMMSNGVEGTPREILGFRESVAMLPKVNEAGTYTIRTKKLYSEEVKPINVAIFKEAKEGTIYKSTNMPTVLQNL